MATAQQKTNYTKRMATGLPVSLHKTIKLTYFPTAPPEVLPPVDFDLERGIMKSKVPFS